MHSGFKNRFLKFWCVIIVGAFCLSSITADAIGETIIMEAGPAGNGGTGMGWKVSEWE